jgi:hypothetical protein
MQIDEYTRLFFQMEAEEGFFTSRTPGGDPFWDVVRLKVFNSLFEEIDKARQFQKSPVSQLLLGRLNKIRRTPLRAVSMVNHLSRLKCIQPSDFLVLAWSRYKDANGNPIDFATDDAYRTLSGMGSTRRFESKQDLFQDINFGTLISIAMHTHRLPAGYQEYFRAIAKVVENAERRYFGIADSHLLDVIQNEFKFYLAQRRVWREILDRSQPRLVATQPGQKGLIVEARKRQIPVIECQHGVINRMHPSYSYPATLAPGGLVILPDAVLLFSEYWKQQCSMLGTELAAVGNNCFSSAGARSTRTGATVFVNAGIFQRYLSPLAVKLAKSMPGRLFIMKLHPAELPGRAMIEREYQGISNLSVVGVEKSCPELFADASDVVVVQSTATYEALDRGVPVHILRKSWFMAEQDLFSRPDVHLFSTAAELQRALFKPVERAESDSPFFQIFDPIVFCKLVHTLIRRSHTEV